MVFVAKAVQIAKAVAKLKTDNGVTVESVVKQEQLVSVGYVVQRQLSANVLSHVQSCPQMKTDAQLAFQSHALTDSLVTQQPENVKQAQ